MAIRYTPGQFRDALGLTKETFRYWKRDLPALAAVSGHSPCFGPREIIATAIAKRVTEKAGVPVSRLAPFASELFELCAEIGWPQLERMMAVLFLEAIRVRLMPTDAFIPNGEPVIIVPLRPLIIDLRERLLEADLDAQQNLAFPPLAMSRGARR